jgi:hypothetical protein
MTRILEIVLEGADAKLGIVPATDVAKLFTSVESAIAKASGHVLGTRVKGTGRRRQVIADASRLRLVGYRDGSLVHILEVPELPIDEASLLLGGPSLGELGVDFALDVLTERRKNIPDVAEAWLSLADNLAIGQRYDGIRLERPNDAERLSTRIDAGVRERLRRSVAEFKAAAIGPNALRGTLYEADFERDTAHLRTPTGDVVSVSFSDELSDEIYAVLRSSTELRGVVTYDPESSLALAITVADVSPGEQLNLGFDEGAFWRTHTASELAEQQGVRAIGDLSSLYIQTTDEETEAFLEALGVEA